MKGVNVSVGYMTFLASHILTTRAQFSFLPDAQLFLTYHHVPQHHHFYFIVNVSWYSLTTFISEKISKFSVKLCQLVILSWIGSLGFQTFLKFPSKFVVMLWQNVWWGYGWWENVTLPFLCLAMCNVHSLFVDFLLAQHIFCNRTADNKLLRFPEAAETALTNILLPVEKKSENICSVITLNSSFSIEFFRGHEWNPPSVWAPFPIYMQICRMVNERKLQTKVISSLICVEYL